MTELERLKAVPTHARKATLSTCLIYQDGDVRFSARLIIQVACGPCERTKRGMVHER